MAAQMAILTGPESNPMIISTRPCNVAIDGGHNR